MPRTPRDFRLWQQRTRSRTPRLRDALPALAVILLLAATVILVVITVQRY